ncbi:MAG: hypothetical protein WAO58_08830 [Fimbriimonadaceae bacterium]
MRITGIVALILAACSGLAQLKPTVSLMQASSALLTQKYVQKHLKLNSKQISSLMATFKGFEEQGKNVQRTAKDRKSAIEKIEGLQLQTANKALAALNPAQKARLKQLGLQMYGPFAILSPDVGKELGLTAVQKKKMRALQAESVRKAQALFQERAVVAQSVPRPQDPNNKVQVDAYRAKLSKVLATRNSSDQKRADTLKRESDAKVLALLTSQQRAKWNAMLGPKFPIPGRRA